jgi:hypothetical protein
MERSDLSRVRILNERLARGEIEKPEYEETKAVISQVDSTSDFEQHFCSRKRKGLFPLWQR